jgi:hypothetical protein
VNADRLVIVWCLNCRHEGVLSVQTLVDADLKPDAPISSFVKRLRCASAGAGVSWQRASRDTCDAIDRGGGLDRCPTIAASPSYAIEGYARRRRLTTQ